MNCSVRKWLMLAVLFTGMMFLVGCGSSSSGSGSDTTAGVRGHVADGYVSGATVEIFNSASFDTPALLQRYTTDGLGEFEISQSDFDDLPDMIYIKSAGGTEITTGFAAPAMKFVGKTGSDSINITPVTDILFEEFISEKGDLDAARSNLLQAGALNYSDTRYLYSDVVADSTADSNRVGEGRNKALTSGVMSQSIQPGNYYLFALPFSSYAFDANDTLVFGEVENKIECYDLTVTDDPDTAGLEIFASSATDTIAGRISGSSFVGQVTMNTGEVSQLAGEVGALGGISGTIIDTDAEEPVKRRGNFVATLLPRDNLPGPAAVAEKVNLFFADTQYFLARSNIRDTISHTVDVHWGSMKFSSTPYMDNSGTHGIDLQQMNIHEWWANQPRYSLPVNEARLLYYGDTPTMLAALSLNADTNNITVFFPVGNRRGIYAETSDTTASNDLIRFGEAYMVKDQSLSPNLYPNTNYDLHVRFVHNSFVDASMNRDTAITYIESANPSIVTPSFPDTYVVGHHFKTGSDTTLFAIAGSMLTTLQDKDADWQNGDQNLQDSQDDNSMIMQFYHSGAFSGERCAGGMTGNLIESNRPVPLVGFINQSGDSTPRYSGRLNLLFRDIAGDVAYGSGHLEFDDQGTDTGTAQLNATDYSGTQISADFEWEYGNGIYHFYGSGGGGAVQDIFWPVGGRKALFMESSGSPLKVDSIGEAYLTY